MSQSGSMSEEEMNSCKILELVQSIATKSATSAAKNAALTSSSFETSHLYKEHIPPKERISFSVSLAALSFDL